MNAVIIILSLCVFTISAHFPEGHHRDQCIAAGIAETTCTTFDTCMKAAFTGMTGEHQRPTGSPPPHMTPSAAQIAEWEAKKTAMITAMQNQVTTCASQAQITGTQLSDLQAKFAEHKGYKSTTVQG